MNLICDHCPEAFLSYRQLQFHKTKFHRPEEPNTCHLCKRTFHKIADLTQHLRVHSQPKRGSRTGGAGKKAYSCSHCCKDFAKESTFSQHLQACRQISRLLVAPREWNAAVRIFCIDRHKENGVDKEDVAGRNVFLTVA